MEHNCRVWNEQNFILSRYSLERTRLSSVPVMLSCVICTVFSFIQNGI